MFLCFHLVDIKHQFKTDDRKWIGIPNKMNVGLIELIHELTQLIRKKTAYNTM